MNSDTQAFLEDRPRLLEKYRFEGSFGEYAAEIAGAAVGKDLQDPLSAAIVREADRILGEDVDGAALKRQVLEAPMVSTADHHALLVYDLLYNSNILHSEISRRQGLPYTVVLPTGSIPLCNRAYPRGFRFRGKKLNFFSHKNRNALVYLFDGKLGADRSQGLASIIPIIPKGSLSADECAFLEHFFFDCLEVERASELESYSDQLTFLDFKLWPYYFDASIRDRIPGHVYLQSNQIIEDLLIEEIANPDSLVSSILFDCTVRELYMKAFDGIQGCWSDGGGSHFFWGISQKQARRRLRLVDGYLVGDGIRIAFERGAVIDALRDKKILPVVFFDFLLITFLSGHLTIGGFNQVEYLPRMQEAHVSCLREIGFDDMAETFRSRVCDAFVCGMVPFDFGSGLDMVWHHNTTGGRFNGSIDRGLAASDLEQIRETSVRSMMRSGVDSMLYSS